MILTKPEVAALIDCGRFNGPYRWKPASMKKLEAKGLAEIYFPVMGPSPGYRLTEAGKKAFSARLGITSQETK